MSEVAHAPLPWHVDESNPEMVFDASGRLVVDCGDAPNSASRDRAEANAALIQRATAAHPLLLARLKTAVCALRSYQNGNSATDLAKEVADACDVVLAQMEGR